MKMRTRTLGPIYETWAKSQSYLINQVGSRTDYPPDWDEDFEALLRHEVMTDLKNPPPPCGFKPCQHTKLIGSYQNLRQYVSPHYLGNATDINTNYFSYSSLLAKGPIPAYLEDLFESEFELTHDDYWAMSTAWERAKPKIEPKLDLLVFLAEISEVPALVKSLGKKLGPLLEDVGSLGGKALKYFDGLKVLSASEGAGGMLKIVADEIGSGISEQWIEYNFALAPTVSELVGLISALLDFRQKLDDLIEGAGKPQKTHCTFKWAEEREPYVIEEADCTYCEDSHGSACQYASSRGLDKSSNSSVPGHHTIHRYPGGLENRIGLTVFYRYLLPDWVHKTSADINALGSALGINPGLGTIWELIPFSFVLDWVYPIGQTLDKARIDAIPIKTEILDVCWTKKQTEPVLIQGRHGTCPLSGESYTIYQGKLERFKRIVGTEPFTSIPAFRWPNWVQLSLGAALAKLLRR